MMYEEEAHQINLIHLLILLAILVIFGIWIIHRGLKKQFKDKTIYSRKESIPIKYEPAFVDCLYHVSVKDGSCIRAWMPEDKKQMLKKMKRDPLRKQQMKKKLEEDQKRKETEKQKEQLDDLAAAQLHGINFEKRLPYLGARNSIDPSRTSVTPHINRSFQDNRHNRFMLRRHSSFLTAKQAGAGMGGGASKFRRERNNSLTSERSCASGMAAVQCRKGSISSLPIPEMGFQPQRTSSGLLLPPQQSTGGTNVPALPLQFSSHLQVQSPTFFTPTSSPHYYTCTSSDSDSHDWEHGAGSHRHDTHRHGSITGVALIDSSLQEVDEEQVSSDEGGLPVVLIPDALALESGDRRSSHLEASNPNINQHNPSPTSSQYMPESNQPSFLKLSGSGILKLGARRSSEAYRDINSEIEEILNITESPKHQGNKSTDDEDASREGHTETDEEEEDEDPVAAVEEEDADFEETDCDNQAHGDHGTHKDESLFVHSGKLFRESTREHNRSKELSVSFMSVTGMGDLERGALSSNNSPKSSFSSSHHKLFARHGRSNASFRTSSFRAPRGSSRHGHSSSSSGGGGGSSLTHKFRGSLSKLQLVKTFSLSSKSTYQHEADAAAAIEIYKNDDCDNSKSSNRSSVDFSRRDSKFQVEILHVEDDATDGVGESKTGAGSDEETNACRNRLTPWLLNLPQYHPGSGNDLSNNSSVAGTSQQGAPGSSRRRNDVSICSNDYPEEAGDTITSLKNVFVVRNM